MATIQQKRASELAKINAAALKAGESHSIKTMVEKPPVDKAAIE